MSGNEFLKTCDACGGSWADMLMSGIKRTFPEVYKGLENRPYTFIELINITKEAGVEW